VLTGTHAQQALIVAALDAGVAFEADHSAVANVLAVDADVGSAAMQVSELITTNEQRASWKSIHISRHEIDGLMVIEITSILRASTKPFKPDDNADQDRNSI